MLRDMIYIYIYILLQLCGKIQKYILIVTPRI